MAPRGAVFFPYRHLPSKHIGRHHPPTGRREAPPDDRPQRAIQYSRGGCAGIEKPQRTGYRAFAGYDDLMRCGGQATQFGTGVCFSALLLGGLHGPDRARLHGGARCQIAAAELIVAAALALWISWAMKTPYQTAKAG